MNNVDLLHEPNVHVTASQNTLGCFIETVDNNNECLFYFGFRARLKPKVSGQLRRGPLWRPFVTFSTEATACESSFVWDDCLCCIFKLEVSQFMLLCPVAVEEGFISRSYYFR